jgi:hypothetical protein
MKIATEYALTDMDREYIAEAARSFASGGNDWQGPDGWGFWFYGGTMSFGANSWCCKNAYAQKIVRYRGDAINAMEALYIAGKTRPMGAECVCL